MCTVALLAEPSTAGGGDCEHPMHFTEISQIKCDHFGSAKTPWLNAEAEWSGALGAADLSILLSNWGDCG